MTAAWAQRSIDGINAKIARAREHHLRLDDELHAYLDSDPLALRKQVENDGTIALFLDVTTPPPLTLSVLVGEIVQQLRSAVDHIAWALVTAAGGSADRTVFPVCTTEPEKGVRVIGGVGEEALARIRDAQPFSSVGDPAVHPLHVLHRLANVDKHRTLHLTVLQAYDAQVFASDPVSGALVGGQLTAGPLRDGDVLGIFRFSGDDVPVDTEVLAGGLTYLVFGEAGPWQTDEPLQYLLERLLHHVDRVVWPRFRPLLQAAT